MLRSVCALLLTSALTAHPCFAQLTPGQRANGAAREINTRAQRPAAAEIDGVYNGTYTCAQGPRTLKLSLTASGEISLVGVFTFYLPPTSHDRAFSYSLNGSYNAATGGFSLTPVQWNTQPPSGYIMVGMEGTFDRGSGRIAGRITHAMCGAFQATRDSSGQPSTTSMLTPGQMAQGTSILTPDQMAQGAAREKRDKLRYVEDDKQRIAQAEAAGAQKVAAAIARDMAHTYEEPGIYDHKPLDLVEARKWYAYAAAKGANNRYATDAAYWLGLMYWDGRGGPQDRERAKYIWMWAAENKEPKAVVKLEELGYDMRKERELAFGKAQAYQSQRPNLMSPQEQMEKAKQGMAIVFGLLLLSGLVNAYYDCEPYQRAYLMGALVGPVPAHCQ